MTAAASTAGVLEWLAAQLAVFQAALLLASGLHKLLRQTRARAAVHEFAGVPRSLAPFAVAAAAAAEMLAAGLLCTAAHRAGGGVLAGLIWSAYLALILRSIARGRREVDCGCTFGAARRPLGAYAVARNFGLVLMAALIALGSAGSAAAAPVIGSQVLAALALLALYFALDQAMALTPPRIGELL
jgi:hypothetical protein